VRVAAVVAVAAAVCAVVAAAVNFTNQFRPEFRTKFNQGQISVRARRWLFIVVCCLFSLKLAHNCQIKF
jgi:hypothetical protein